MEQDNDRICSCLHVHLTELSVSQPGQGHVSKPTQDRHWGKVLTEDRSHSGGREQDVQGNKGRHN